MSLRLCQNDEERSEEWITEKDSNEKRNQEGRRETKTNRKEPTEMERNQEERGN